jgi:Predicted membrane protein (DUF2207) C-terminal domain/Predicted membrane protein (DUF2207) N-terminal domain
VKPSARLLAVLCVLALPPALAARTWHISDFSDTINIQTDGSASVRERLTLVFEGEFHGIHRVIPIENLGPAGTNYTLFLDVTGVTGENGESLKYEVKTSNGFRDITVYIPNAVDTTRTIEISYSVRNGLRYFPDYDEFYWNVTGNDWQVPIDRASAMVMLPAAAAGQLRAQAFTGVYGSKERDVTTDVDGATVSLTTNHPLPMRGGLTVDIYIPKGVLKEPGKFTYFLWFIGSNPIVFLPFVTFGVMFAIWWWKGRDPDPGRSVAPMYEPPPGMTPAEAGTLIDDRTDPRDITCTLVDLAVRGYLKIEETTDTTLLVFHSKDYIFHLLKPREQWTDLTSYERVMLDNVFVAGNDTRLSGLKNRFYTALPIIRQNIMAALRNKGMYLLDPDSANAYSLLGAGLSLAPFLIAQFTGYKQVFTPSVLTVISVLISLIVWWLFARQMKARTVQGARTRIAVIGFQEFMNRVDADRIKRMPPDTFEKYLPYAMALGVEHHWAQAFAGIVTNPPSWYVSPGGYAVFNPILFSSSMHSMATDMHQVFVSSPRSSSTSSGWGGGGGGGFSGGGFGGGGGSAF